MRGFIVVASRADVYTTSASASNVFVYTKIETGVLRYAVPASNVFVYTKTLLRCKMLAGNTQALELHRFGAGLKKNLVLFFNGR